MDYGLQRAAGGTLANTGLTTGQQVAICISAVILVGVLAWIGVRIFWRRGKKLGDK